MRSLFFKIFIIFWIAQSLIFVITTALILTHRFPHPASMLDPAFTSLHIEAAQALQEFDAKGCAGFQSFAQGRREEIALIDDSGKMVCGGAVLSATPQIASADEIDGRRVGNDTVWTFPVSSATGRTYRYVVSVHREQHTRVGDLLHFAFPQLPVAIAVGGATTFALVLLFTRPVNGLRKAARQMAQGNLSARVKERHGSGQVFRGDEFDALVHDFNHMAERLESLVNAHKLLLRDVSHELRSPLARLSVALELTREDADPALTAHLDRIRRETERLNQLIGQLLTLSSMESIEELHESESFSLQKVLCQMLPDAEYEARQRDASIVLRAECECIVNGQRELVYRAVENVVRNAIRFTEPGTQVEIELANGTLEKMALIEVSDRGPGIPQSELESIFRPFYRVDSARSAQTGGSGVGLAIAERAVKLHNGRIRAMNRAGGGTTIQIALPLAALRGVSLSSP
jgi:two-component system, OmpR family, sensor histidine kinase CpxA